MVHYIEIYWLLQKIIFSFLSWFCHVDDDVYVIMDNLVKLLSKMDPKTEARYIGKAGTSWKHPLPVSCCFYITVIIIHVSIKMSKFYCENLSNLVDLSIMRYGSSRWNK